LPSAGSKPSEVALARTAALSPGTASMKFPGPVKKETQVPNKPPVHSEFEKHKFTEGGVYGRSTRERVLGVDSQAHWDGGSTAGDGSKFSAGFFRKKVDWSGEYNARDEAGAARCVAQDALRKDFIVQNQQRCGYNPVTGAEVDTSKDNFRARGRV